MKLSQISIREEITDGWPPVTEDDYDTNPSFRKVLRLLNAAGFATKSSCQGHPPRSQYEDVKVWMDPYITFAGGSNVREIARLLRQSGYVSRIGREREPNGPRAVSLRRDIDWEKLLKFLTANLKQLPPEQPNG